MKKRWIIFFLFWAKFVLLCISLLVFIIVLLAIFSSGIGSILAAVKIPKINDTFFDIINVTISVGTMLGGACIYLIRFIRGGKSNLQKDNLEVRISDTQEIRDIPNMICLFPGKRRIKEQDVEKLDVGMLEMYKGSVKVTFTGEGVDNIALYLITNLKITFTNNNTTYKYKEIELARDEKAKKTALKWKNRKSFRERSNRSGIFVLNAFLLVFRPRYADRHSYVNTADFFSETNDEMKIAINFFAIKNTGSPLYYASGEIDLKQKIDEEGNIYWQSYND